MKPIIFNTRDELIRVELDKLVYAEADGNYVTMTFLNGQRIMVCITLQHLEELILQGMFAENKGRFIRIGRRFIVCSRHITQINVLKQTLTLSDLQTFSPITITVHKDALKALKKSIVGKYEAEQTDTTKG